MLLAVVGVALATSVALGFSATLASPGKVHSVHAAWEHDCSVCHEPLSPTSSRNGLQEMLKAGPVSDKLCQNCHSGPPHHPGREKESEVGSCSSCHVEHRGRHSQLSQVSDSLCTNCHANLEQHTEDHKPVYENKITGFDIDHPQFKIGPPGQRRELGSKDNPPRDPGKLKFNHKLHLTEGLTVGWKLDRIDKSMLERYKKLQPPGRNKNEDLVHLKCGACHQLDGAEAPKAAAIGDPGRTTGEYMQPVTYEQHCKACHPLTFDPAVPNVEVPHLLQPAEVRRFLWGVYAGEEVKKRAPDKKPAADRPLPGHNLTREELDEMRARMSGNVNAAESALYVKALDKAVKGAFTGKPMCALCHQFDWPPGEKLPKEILPTDVPRVWFPHSKFTHKAHRMAGCLECHDAEKSTTNTDILLPGIENCQECHRPAGVEDGKKVGGVRHDCVACHRYHLGDAPEAGPGARKRGIKVRKTLQEFLDGK